LCSKVGYAVKFETHWKQGFECYPRVRFFGVNNINDLAGGGCERSPRTGMQPGPWKRIRDADDDLIVDAIGDIVVDSGQDGCVGGRYFETKAP